MEAIEVDAVRAAIESLGVLGPSEGHDTRIDIAG
jgi:hypothetical protein